VRSRIFTSPCRPDRFWVPLNLVSIGIGGLFLSLGVRRPGREVDHSPPTSAEVKKMWIYTSTPPHAFLALCLVKHRDNFTLPYYGSCRQPVGLLRRWISPVARSLPAHWTRQTEERGQTLCLEWDSNPRSHASDRAATVVRHVDNINAFEFVQHAATLSCAGRREASVLVLAPPSSPAELRRAIDFVPAVCRTLRVVV
jgi:hypothetical protein